MQGQRVVALFSALKQLLKIQGKKHKETKQLNHPKIKIEFCSSLTLRGGLVPLHPSCLPDTVSRIFYYLKTNMTGVGFYITVLKLLENSLIPFVHEIHMFKWL